MLGILGVSACISSCEGITPDTPDSSISNTTESTVPNTSESTVPDPIVPDYPEPIEIDYVTDRPVAYGVPHITYSVKGKVVDSKTGLGVAGIEVKEEWSQTDTTGTDGSFELSGDVLSSQDFKVILRDIDPDKDGNYKSDTVQIQLTQVEDAEGWCAGKFEAKDVVLNVEEQ